MTLAAPLLPEGLSPHNHIRFKPGSLFSLASLLRKNDAVQIRFFILFLLYNNKQMEMISHLQKEIE